MAIAGEKVQSSRARMGDPLAVGNDTCGCLRTASMEAQSLLPDAGSWHGSPFVDLQGQDGVRSRRRMGKMQYLSAERDDRLAVGNGNCWCLSTASVEAQRLLADAGYWFGSPSVDLQGWLVKSHHLLVAVQRGREPVGGA